MKRFAWSLLTILLLWPSPAQADGLIAPELPQPIFVRQNAFGVPYVMDPAQPSARRAVEVQLHVSENGSPWKLYAKAPPVNGSIRFQANRDGEYRFMVRTKDEHGELNPVGPPHPELIAIVDTDPPVVELLAERGTGAEVRARWRVRDPHLKPESLRVEYQVGPDGPWNNVAVDLPAIGATSSAREATWVPEAREVAITVRAEVSDFAGNIAKSQRTIPGVRPKRDAAVASGVGANGGDAGAIAKWPAERTHTTPLGPADPPTMPDNFPWREEAERSLAGANRRPRAEEVLPRERMTEPETLPAPQSESVYAQPSQEYRLPVPHQPEEVELPPTAAEARHPTPRTRREVNNSDGPRLPWPDAMPPSMDSVGQMRDGESVNELVPPLDGELLPPGEQPRMISARRIELDYEVTATQIDAVRQVEVWGTRDGGRTWSRFATDDDKASPAVIEVDNDGVYGFRIVVVKAAGDSDEPPHAGDAPDVMIGVDTTKPVARLTSTDPGLGAQAGTVSIRWEASDSMLGKRPITLYSSLQATGPWAPISTDLENSGEFTWHPEPGTPTRVYLRLQARDMAGNAEVIDTPAPVSLVPTRPRTQIRGVRPGA